MGWWITLAVLLLLGCLPLGISVIYQAGGPSVKLLLGPIRYPVFPGKPKEEKPKKKKPNKKEKPPVQKEAPKEQEKKGGSFLDFFPLLQNVTDFLGDFRRKLRVKQLELYLCMAGDDPCDLAINYGKAWAAVGNIMPILERLFVIKKRNVQVSCDFTATETTIYLRADVTITLGRLLGLLVRHGWRAGKKLLTIMNQRKGGAVK